MALLDGGLLIVVSPAYSWCSKIIKLIILKPFLGFKSHLDYYMILLTVSNVYLQIFLFVNSAHTQESAKALANTISTVCQNCRLVVVVAMASDKDHSDFAKELLSPYGLVSYIPVDG